MANGFVHIELNTENLGDAKKFYKTLFNWKLADQKMAPGMTYTMIDTGAPDTAGGGMQVKPMAEAPNHWLPYVQVDSVKKTIEKARKLGANVLVDFMPMDNMGALGVFMDPAGAALGVWEAGAPVKKAAAKKTAPAKKTAAKKATKKATKKARR